MKCKECPAFSLYKYKDYETGLCFCSCHETTKTEAEADCQYGIEDYKEYIKKKLNS